jgi:hypothetical protein
MNHDQIESAIEHAINALSLAKLALSKSALPIFDESDIIRKSDLDAPVVSAADAALASLADLQARVDELKCADAKRNADEAVCKRFRVQS